MFHIADSKVNQAVRRYHLRQIHTLSEWTVSIRGPQSLILTFLPTIAMATNCCNHMATRKWEPGASLLISHPSPAVSRECYHRRVYIATISSSQTFSMATKCQTFSMETRWYVLGHHYHSTNVHVKLVF